MSKVKKKPTRAPGGLSEEEVKLEKILQFSGWISFIVLLLFLGAWLLLDFLLDIIQLQIGASIFAFIIFIGTNAALNFGVATRIRKNRDQKKKLFLDWIVGEFLFCMIAIFAVAVYQW